MVWMRGGKGLVCPSCQIPRGYVDGVEGRFLQCWDSGFCGGVLRVQEYVVGVSRKRKWGKDSKDVGEDGEGTGGKRVRKS